MDEIDKRILNILQADLPVEARPFASIAQAVGIDEDEVIQRIAAMKHSGSIRRLGAVFDPRKLGYVSALCAARVSEKRESALVSMLNGFDGVTHNYRRDDAYNIWFTVIVPTETELTAFLDAVRKQADTDDVLCMRAVRTFKVNAQFEV